MTGAARAGVRPVEVPVESAGTTVSVEDLGRAITRALDGHLGGHSRTAEVSLRPSPYRSTRPLLDVDARLGDGRTLHLILKQIEGTGPPALHGSRPAFLRDARREAEVYRRLLRGGRFGVPRCYGSWSDGEGATWLLLERVEGVPLRETALTDWGRVASWLGEIHARFSRQAAMLERRAGLPRVGEEYLERWLQRAARFRAHGPEGRRMRRLLLAVEALEPRLSARVLALPRTFIHGEFYPANILIRAGGPTRVCPVDWETATVGPGLLDLAALVTGLDAAQASELVEAYQRGWCGAGGRAAPPRAAVDRGLLHCRLQLSLQWLGWAREWSAPPHQARDWLSEAEEIVKELSV